MSTQQFDDSPLGSPISPAPALAPVPVPVLAPPPMPPRRTRGAKIAIILLSVGLVLSLLGGGGAVLVVGGAAVRQSDRADRLQRQIEQQKAAEDAQAAALTDLKAKFDSANFPDRYRKMKDAATKEATALQAYLDTKPETKQADDAFVAWQDAIYACLTMASDYNLASKDYPAEWFDSTTPAVVDLGRSDTRCYSWQG
jgi:hypothetical protein